MKTRRVAAELFHEGGRTDKRRDMTKLIVTFRKRLKMIARWKQLRHGRQHSTRT